MAVFCKADYGKAATEDEGEQEDDHGDDRGSSFLGSNYSN